METNENGFSLLKLIAESELQRRKETQQSKSKKISFNDTSAIAETIKDVIYDQTINIDGNTYTINAADVDKNSILLWLFSESADEDKTIKITLKVDELEVDASYWD